MLELLNPECSADSSKGQPAYGRGSRDKCMTYFVYFIESEKNKKVYVGLTSKSPQQRLQEHNNGSNQWSRHNKPFHLCYFERYQCFNDGRQRESFYKTGFGKSIKKLILSYLKENNIKP